jgi:hypothetical protein
MLLFRWGGQTIRLEETDGGSAKARSAVSEGDEE